MNKTKLYEHALSIASDITDLPVDVITDRKNKTSCVVDARYIVVYVLSNNGLYPNEIAQIIGYTSTNVRLMINKIRERADGNSAFENKMKIVRKYNENNCLCYRSGPD